VIQYLVRLITSKFMAFHRIFRCRKSMLTGVDYWNDRARKFGKRAVVDLNYGQSQVDSVTEFYSSKLLPVFSACLHGDEKVVLDFGCGWGRFSHNLAMLTGGKVVGVDPVSELLKFARETENVQFLLLRDDSIPLPDESVDIVWVCLVLGGIDDTSLNKVAAELTRVLKKDGLLFLVENITQISDVSHWHYRSFDFYRQLLPEGCLQFKTSLSDNGEVIAVMAGRKV